MSLNYLSGRKLKILLHIVVWAVLFIIPTYMIYGGSPLDQTFLKEVWVQIAFYAIIFYVSYLWLAPRLFFLEKKIWFFLLSAAIIMVLTLSLGKLFQHFSPVSRDQQKITSRMWELSQEDPANMLRFPPPRNHPPGPVKGWPIFNFLLTSCLITGLSLGLRLSEKLILNEKMRKEAEKERLHTEVAFLKHKINPHFLFNTLNSIYSLALIKSDLTAEAVMKLSDMMRYVIQEVDHEKVPLELGLEYVAHYVELQKFRLSSNVEVQMNITGDPKPYEIPPMILVPFIENAFKYGISTHENATITINLDIGSAIPLPMLFRRLPFSKPKPLI